MIRKIAASIVTVAVALALTSTAGATGQTTNKTYTSAKQAATHVAAMFMNKRAYNKYGSAGWWHATDLKASKLLSTSATGVTQKWLVVTKSKTDGKPYKSVVVSVKSLSGGLWKGFSGGSWISKIN
jgi:hypothetical protein